MHPILTGDQILQCIPQRAPFVLVDRLLESDRLKTKAGFFIPEHHVLVADQVLTESGMVENMAQTAALHAGYSAMKSEETAPIGFIAAIKNLKILNLPTVGQLLETVVTPKHETMGINTMEASVFLGPNLIATCELKIFLQPEDH